MGIERTIDITTEQRKTILALLERYLPGAAAWVYGSRAKWTSRPQSDLDLMVFPASEQHDRVGALREAFEESNLPFQVDLFVWDEVPDSFRKQIETERVVLIEKKDRQETNEWTEYRLADACTSIDYGLTASASSCRTGPHFLRITDIVSGYIDWKKVPHVSVDDDIESKYRLYDGDIVIARTGASTGMSAYVKNPPKAVFASYLVRLQTKPGFDARFISYYLKSNIFWEFIHGVLGDKSAQPNASASTMTAAPLSVTKNKREQSTIANILGSLDDKIELNRRMNETLEEMARALFKSWFIDFDPVRAKMEGRDIGLPKHIADLFPDRMVDSEIGKIPEGWKVGMIGNLASILGGTTPSTKERQYWEHGSHCWATPKDLSDLQVPVLLDTERKITDLGLSKIGSGLLPKGTVLLSSRAPIGYLAVTEIPAAINQGFIAMLPFEKVSTLFLLYWCDAYHDKIESHANGSTFLEISKGNFRQISIVIPSMSIIEAFDTFVRPLFNNIVSSSRESQILYTLRDALLPKLISGELRVKMEAK